MVYNNTCFTNTNSNIYIPSIFDNYNLVKIDRVHNREKVGKNYKNSYFSFTLFPRLDGITECLYLPCQSFPYVRWGAGLPCYANMFSNYAEITAPAFKKVLNNRPLYDIVRRCWHEGDTQSLSFKIKDDYWSVDKGAIFLNKKLVGLAVYKIHVGDLNIVSDEEHPNIFTFLSSTYLLDISLKDTHKKIYSLIIDYISTLCTYCLPSNFSLNTKIYYPNSESISEYEGVRLLGEGFMQVQYCSADFLSQFYRCSYNE